MIVGLSAVVVILAAVVVIVHTLGMPTPGAPASVPIDEQAFPDDVVRAAVQGFDTDHDGSLSSEEGAAVTVIRLDGPQQLPELAKYFPNVDTLIVLGDAPLSVDVGGLTKLRELRLPQGATVSGLDKTQVREAWVTSKIVEQEAGGAQTRTYEVRRDDAGRMTGRTVMINGQGYVKSFGDTFEYDGSGRIAAMSTTPELGDADRFTYAYADDGSLQKVSSASSGATYTLDHGRLTAAAESSYGSVYPMQLGYDDQGRLTGLTRTSGIAGENDHYTYVYDDKGKVVTTTVDALGIRANRVQVTGTYGYDGSGRLASVSYAGDNANLTFSASFSYDGDGRVTSANTDKSSHLGYCEASFSYDDAGRLTHAESGFQKVGAITDGTDHARVNYKTYDVTYERLFIGKDDPDPDAGYSLETYSGFSGYDFEIPPLVSVRAPIPGVPDPTPDHMLTIAEYVGFGF